MYHPNYLGGGAEVDPVHLDAWLLLRTAGSGYVTCRAPQGPLASSVAAVFCHCQSEES